MKELPLYEALCFLGKGKSNRAGRQAYKWEHMISVFLWLYLVWYPLGPSMLLQMSLFYSFLWLSNISVCVWVCVYTDKYLYIHTHTYSTHTTFLKPRVFDGHLDCFHVLALKNCAAMNTGMHVFFKIILEFHFFQIHGQEWDWIAGSYDSSIFSI